MSTEPKYFRILRWKFLEELSAKGEDRAQGAAGQTASWREGLGRGEALHLAWVAATQVGIGAQSALKSSFP